MAFVAQKLLKTICPAHWRAKSVQPGSRVDRDEFAIPLVVTSSDHRFWPKNRCAIAAVLPILQARRQKHRPSSICRSASCDKHNGDALLLVMPSDHHIPDQDARKDGAGGPSGGERVIGHLGAPNRPETGYGYIELANQLLARPLPLKIS